MSHASLSRSSIVSSRVPKVEIVTAENGKSLVKDSSEFKKTVIGEAFQRLG
jgi:hypothetical protein